MAIHVRLATNDDCRDLSFLILQYWQEAPLATKSLDSILVADRVRQFIREPNMLALVAERDGKIIGVMGACICEHQLWSRELAALDCILYLLPEERGGWAAPKMIREYQRWAKANGAKYAYLSVASGIKSNQSAGLYGAMGFHFVGYQYRKELV